MPTSGAARLVTPDKDMARTGNTAKPNPLIPDDPRLQPLATAEQWAKMIGLITDGVTPPQAADAAGIQRWQVEGILRTVPERFKEWQEAKLVSLRRGWPMESIESVCQRVSEGFSLKEACATIGKTFGSFAQLMLKDTVVSVMYDDALKIRSELWADEVITLSDDDTQDIDLTGRGNNAAVSRSGLQVQTRMKLMEHYNRDRFGPPKKEPNQVNVQVNVDHADRLESARARQRKAAQQEEPTDAQFTALPAPAADDDDTSWME